MSSVAHDFFLRVPGPARKAGARGVVQRLVQAVILRNLAIAANVVRHFGLIKNVGEIQAARLPVLDGFLGFEQVGAADHFGQRAEAKLRHDFADFLRR